MKRNTSKHKRKFRLLLDAAFARPKVFRGLCKRANVSHVVFDWNLPPQASDEEIIRLAVKEERIIVTINYKDFKKLLRSNKSGVIAIPPHLSNEEIDKLLSDFVQNNDFDKLMGQAVKLQ